MKKTLAIFGLILFGSTISFAQVQTNNIAESSSIIDLLQGKWQSMEDKTNFLVFDKNERKEIAEGMEAWDIELFELSDKCLNESDEENETELEKEKYISCKESEICWYIVSINKDFLTLSFMGRGNSLKYKKVK